MPKLYASREIIKVLEQRGFVYKSQKGSHVKYTKGIYTVIVPHPKSAIPYGTFSSIVRQAGLTKDDFK
jgi:predicted RNA binding protein YcfA (HicA-like mRNA interferase family)